jgi:phenylacetate-CoA ligase
MADMPKLPLLTKDDIRQYKQDLIAQNYRQKLLKANTGGSTGQPLELHWEHGKTRSAERAFMWRQWRWAGFEYGQRTAVLRGQTVKEIIHYDPIDQHLFLSGFALDDQTAQEYLATLRKFRPVSIQAYPASITVLANYMKHHNEPPLDGLKVILAGSENLYPAQRRVIEEVFQCRVFSWYGHGEVTTLAGGCDHSNLYHVYNEYGYTELIDPEGNALEWQEGVKGEIVGTGFNNWAMPLIRYRTADIAVVGPPSCPCGRHYPLWERIEGRKQEYVVARDGKLVPLTALIFGQHYHAFAKIKRMQIVQDRPGEMVVRLMVNDDWVPADEHELRQEMGAVLADNWQFGFDYVDSIPFTAAGKHRFVIQNIPLDTVWAGEQAHVSEEMDT